MVILLFSGCGATERDTDSYANGNVTPNSSSVGDDSKEDNTTKAKYGVFIGLTEVEDYFTGYETIVIDAQYFDKEEIDDIKSSGTTVYSYINVGSLESFRNYYEEYVDLTLASYENWEEERWVDVSDVRWQNFVINTLAQQLLAKDIDGFFVDNCDVYYQFGSDEILNGLSLIMRALVATGKDVIINGGDCFLDAYCDKGGIWNDVVTGINQESVFSKILWDSGTFGAADEEDRRYFIEYIEKYSALGADIFLIEYTSDNKLIGEIEEYCNKNGFRCYISDTIELT